jgi:hypothetical protein
LTDGLSGDEAYKLHLFDSNSTFVDAQPRTN